MHKIDLKPGEYVEFPSWQTLRAYVDAHYDPNTWTEDNKEQLLYIMEYYEIRRLICTAGGRLYVSNAVWPTMIARVEYPTTTNVVSAGKGCECGAEKIKGFHSTWCPAHSVSHTGGIE